MTEPVSLEERYSSALGSHHLKLSTDRFGDVDLLIACGWVREGLGTGLYRLRAEFDAVKGEDRIASAYLAGLRQQHAKQRLSVVASEAKKPAAGSDEAKTLEKFRREVELLAEQIERETLSLRALVLMGLKTLAPVTKAMRHYSEQMAARRGMADADPMRVYRVAGRVLESILDPLCPKCEGRGFWGGYGKQRIWHQGRGSCERSGRRRVQLGQSADEEAFGRWMLADLERKLTRVDALMRRFLRAKSGGPWAARIQQDDDLSVRLEELRSAEAQAD